MFILKKETSGCTHLPFLNSGVAGPKFTQFTQKVLDHHRWAKSEWRYFKPFWDVNV